MLTAIAFYARAVWGLRFGESGSAYTIVPGRHIGQDIKRTGDVPALLSGTVTAVVLTSAMAWCVEVLTAGGVYLTYCHLANDTLPKTGDTIGQGARVGRLARGPVTLPLRDPDFPGTAWTGQHLHLVASRIARAAWQKVPGRQLSDFIDPTTIIAGVLAAPASTGATPFTPEQEDIIMSTGPFIVSHKTGDATALYLVGPGVKGGMQWISPGFFDIGTADWWKLTDGKPILADLPTFDTRGNGGAGGQTGNQVAFDLIKSMFADDPASITTTVDVDGKSIADQVIAALSPATLAQQIIAAGVAKAVADELAKRLAS